MSLSDEEKKKKLLEKHPPKSMAEIQAVKKKRLVAQREQDIADAELEKNLTECFERSYLWSPFG